MKVSCSGNNLFGIRHYFKKHPNGNEQNRQHPDLANTQRHKKFAKIVGIHGIILKHDTKIR